MEIVLKLTLIVLILNISNAAYRDPKKTYFEFNEKPNTEESKDSSTGNCDKCVYEKKGLCTYLKSFLRLIVENANRELDEQTLTFDLTLTIDKLDKIENLLSSSTCDSELPPILNGIRSRPLWKKLLHDDLTSFISSNRTLLGLIITTLIVFLILMWWIHISKSYWSAFVKILVLAFTASVIVTFYRNYQKASVKKYVKLKAGIPLKCRPEDVAWYHSIWYFWYDKVTVMPDECEEFFNAQMVDVLVETTIFEAFMETLTKSILTPLPFLLEYIGLSFKALLRELPVQFWFPLSLFIIILVFFLVFSQQRYRFHHYLLGTLEPADSNRMLQAQSGNIQAVNAPVTNITNIPLGGSESMCSLQASGENVRVSINSNRVLVEHGGDHNRIQDLAILPDHSESAGTASDSQPLVSVAEKLNCSVEPQKENISLQELDESSTMSTYSDTGVRRRFENSGCRDPEVEK